MPAPGDSLSPRETEILERVAYGQTNREIAKELGISHHTVKTHLHRIFVKLGADRRSHAVALAGRRRVPVPPPPVRVRAQVGSGIAGCG
jgi:DNA-binding CsgD family transcriptional regulator